MNKNENLPDVNRRNFLKNTSLATLMAVMGGVELRAEDAPKAAAPAEPALTPIPVGPPVNFGVIGLGAWGREVVSELSKLPNTPIVAICDTYPASVRRAGDVATTAEKFDDYKLLLAKKEVQAVVICTPTPSHREIALAALAAGKHVYCEAPLAGTEEDTKAIAKAARDSAKLVFQPGLQYRSHPQLAFLLPFVRAGAIGKNVMAHGQWHKKDSWSRVSSNPDHQNELNWRLRSATSTGLIGEVGIHQLDTVNLYFRNLPSAVTGFGSIILWDDGRDVPDTIQTIFEYPDGATYGYDATLCNSFDGQYEIYYGTNAAIMVRDYKAWMFQEVDSPLNGWEVYARKDMFYTSTGVALVANATKQAALGAGATGNSAYPYTALSYALQAFTDNVGQVSATVDDFISNFGDSDPKALQERLDGLKLQPAANWKDGLEATLLAIKANEAVMKKQRVTVAKELFEL